MEEFVVEWNKKMESLGNGEPPPHNSRAQFLNGKILYSPNCRRDVRIPPPPDPCKNPFLPSLYRRSKDSREPSTKSQLPSYDFTEINMSMYMQPSWWTDQWGWAAFIPRRVNYSLHIFSDSDLDKMPLAEDLVTEMVSVESKENKQAFDFFIRYSLGERTKARWSALEDALFRVVHHLSLLTKAAYIGPPLPCVFGYKKTHSTRWKALHAIRCSRDWFAVWIGLVSYLTSLANNMHSIPDWRHYLFSLDYSPQWVHALSTASSWDYEDTRVGAFIDLSDRQPKRREPLIDWLTCVGVPVWYFLDLAYAAHPTIGPAYIRYEPGQDASNSIDHTSSTSKTVNTLASTEGAPSSRPPDSPPSWQEFFKKRDARNQKKMEKETAEQRISRQDREKNPPTTSAKVYIWVPDDSGVLVRELVCRRERADTLSIYADDEIKYDSFSNEYDCCEDFGSGKGLSKQDVLDAWEYDEGDIAQEVSAADISTVSDRILQSTEPTLLPSIVDDTIESADGWLPSHVANKCSGNVFKAEQEILDILRIHFGYTPLLPVPPPPSSPVNETDQRSFLKVIGLSHKAVSFEVFMSPNIFAAVGFIRRLCQQQGSILENEWDLGRNHPQSLAFSQRLKRIQTLHCPNSTPTIFMFDFGADQTVTWKLAVTSASDALMICRLDPEWDEVAVALFLLQNGIPFHTLQSVSTFPPARPRRVQFPSRPPQYQFDQTDYSVYLEGVKHLLKGPCGRVALMMGGYIWRLAVALVSFEMVFEGPSGRSSAILAVETQDGKKYFDDQMAGEDADILCGLHHCLTGQGDQVAKKSWYPLRQAYEGSGHDYKRWTSNSEAIFGIFNTRNFAASQDKKKITLQRQPLPANKWRDASRGSSDTRRSRQRLENASLALLLDTKA